VTDDTNTQPPSSTPAKKKAPPKKILVVLVGGYDNGTRRMFPVEKAERLIRNGHARRP
jgi:hypothetical protein